MEKIGRHVYALLKGNPDLTPEQMEQVKDYETRKGIVKQSTEADIAYLELLNQKAKVYEQGENKIESGEVFKRFKFIWQKQVGVEWVDNKDTRENLRPVIYWFCRDPRFFECKHLSKLSEPSFDKGLLLMGGYGSGKSETMRMLHFLFSTDHFRSYKFLSVNKVVQDYETRTEAVDKEGFYKYMLNGRTCFDDLKNERDASNYGKVSIMKEILIQRANERVMTHGTANYKKGFPGDMKAAIEEFGEKYDAVLYDRLFAQFNFIEFTGKSFRK